MGKFNRWRSTIYTVVWIASVILALPTAASAQRIEEGMAVEVDGTWTGEYIAIKKLVREIPDDLPEIKGHPTKIDQFRSTLTIPPFVIEIDNDTDIDDADDEGDSYVLGEFELEWHYEIEVEKIGPNRFRAVEVEVDRRKRKDVVEVESRVERVRTLPDGSIEYTLLGIPCRTTPTSEIIFEIRQTTPSGDPERPIDPDDVRPDGLSFFGNRIKIGGEFQLDYDYRDNYDLDDGDNEDTFIQGLSATLEGTWDWREHGFLFAKLRTVRDDVIFDEERDLDLSEQTQLDEGYVWWNLPTPVKTTIQVGRQDFEDRREWHYDANLDAARLRVEWRQFEFEYSWSALISDAPRDQKDRYQQIAALRWYYMKESYLAGFVLDMRDDSGLDDEPFYIAARVLHDTRNLIAWADYSFMTGVLGTQDVEAHALDVGAALRFPNLPLRPYVFGGYAMATGDSKTSGDSSRAYRQTEFADNNERIFGVASYRYYGELFRPNLSNMHIATIGAGISPRKWYSLDVAYHYYRQDERVDDIFDSRLREDPSGFSRDLGQEIDVVFGLDKIFGHFDLELTYGYFVPGDAFANNDDDPAMFVAVQFEWNF